TNDKPIESMADLNKMSDEELQERVYAVEMLRRLHNAVASFIRERGEGFKQSALSGVVANVRGARPRFHSRDEYEYPAYAIETATYQLSE
ncbi:MAG: hypothetical protein SGPRY_012624, partial [Prymnesium sp.]